MCWGGGALWLMISMRELFCVGQQGVVVDVFPEDNVPVVLKGISIGHSMGVVLG